MFSFFKCKHPAAKLVVEKEATAENFKSPGYKRFTNITYHLRCRCCGEIVKIKHARYG